MLQLHGTRLILDDRETNFDIRELVPPSIFRIWGGQSIRFLQKDGVRWLQFCREWFEKPHRLNNWYAENQARVFTLRGYRPAEAGFFTMVGDVHGHDLKDQIRELLQVAGVDIQPFGTGSWVSVHKLGGAFDFTVDGLHPNEVRREMIDHETDFMNAGLTTLESERFAPTWIHGDNRPTGRDEILIVEPQVTRS